MLDARLFRALPADRRRRLADEYIAFVHQRDGTPDVEGRTLSNRETWFEGLKQRPAPRFDGTPLDPDEFRAFHLGQRPIREATPLMIWLVQVARANEGEGWGVDYLLARGGFQGLGKGGHLQPRDFADLEETYHTRIFRETVRLFGLDFTLRPPPLPIQRSVKILGHLPETLSFMLLAAGEIMGTVAFSRLTIQADRLLGEHPEVLARIHELFDEILVDEIGHVTYLLGSMNALQLSMVHRLAILFLAGTRNSYLPGARVAEEAAILRRGIEEYSLAIFPERVLRRAFVPAEYWPKDVPAVGMQAAST